jgi:Spy/CpxP family protein refolding chaperone
MSPEPSRRRIRWVSGLVLAGMFGAGVATGLGLAPIIGGRPPGMGPEGHPVFPAREIGLSAEQEAQVRDILARNQPRMDQLLAEMLPPLQALSADIESQIVQVLTPEQRERFKKFKAGRPPPLPPGLGPPPTSGH